MDFSKYQAMSFDCYGTLVDWESGILSVLRKWAARHNVSTDDAELIRLFGEHERQVQTETPDLLYPKVLAEVLRRIAASKKAECTEEDAREFGDSVGDWPVFADSADALRALSERFRIFILSNVDRASFARTMPKLGIEFDGIVTAEDVGSYKPDPKNFNAIRAAVAGRSIDASCLLHVGESIHHDVIPATRAALDTVWIDRQEKNPEKPRASGSLDATVTPTMVFGSMAAFVQAATKGA